MALMGEPQLPGTALDTELGELFTNVITAVDLNGNDSGLPDHLALYCVLDERHALERLRILNWDTKDCVDVLRKVLIGESDVTKFESPFEPGGVDFKLIASDMLDRPYKALGESKEDIEIPTLYYEVLPGKLRRWAPLGEDTYIEANGELGDDVYINIENDIRTMIGLDALKGLVTVTPDMFK